MSYRFEYAYISPKMRGSVYSTCNQSSQIMSWVQSARDIPSNISQKIQIKMSTTIAIM
jgi:hypothetical protein